MVQSVFIYHSLFIFLGIFSSFISKIRTNSISEKSIKGIIVFIMCSIPALLAAFRYGIGTDYFNYVEIFQNISHGYESRTEIGFNFINWVVAFFGANEHVLFFVMNFLTVLFVYLFLENYKGQLNIGIGMLVYCLIFYNQSFNIVRQALAMTIGLFAFTYIDKREPIKYYFWSIIAASLHLSAIVLLPIYSLYNILGKKSLSWRLVIYLIILIGIFNYEEIISFVSVNILNDPYYLLYTYAYIGEAGFSLGILFIFLPYILIGIFFYKDMSAYNKSFPFYFFLLIIGFILRSVASLGVQYLGRVGDYFYICVVWLAPFYYNYFSTNKNFYWIKYLIVIFVVLVWFVGHFLGEPSDTVPYISIFSLP